MKNQLDTFIDEHGCLTDLLRCMNDQTKGSKQFEDQVNDLEDRLNQMGVQLNDWEIRVNDLEHQFEDQVEHVGDMINAVGKKRRMMENVYVHLMRKMKPFRSPKPKL